MHEKRRRFLLIDKPKGVTSFDVLRCLRTTGLWIEGRRVKIKKHDIKKHHGLVFFMPKYGHKNRTGLF